MENSGGKHKKQFSFLGAENKSVGKYQSLLLFRKTSNSFQRSVLAPCAHQYTCTAPTRPSELCATCSLECRCKRGRSPIPLKSPHSMCLCFPLWLCLYLECMFYKQKGDEASFGLASLWGTLRVAVVVVGALSLQRLHALACPAICQHARVAGLCQGQCTNSSSRRWKRWRGTRGSK